MGNLSLQHLKLEHSVLSILTRFVAGVFPHEQWSVEPDNCYTDAMNNISFLTEENAAHCTTLQETDCQNCFKLT